MGSCFSSTTSTEYPVAKTSARSSQNKLKTLAMRDIKGFKKSDSIENFYDIQKTIGHGKTKYSQEYRFLWRSCDSCTSPDQSSPGNKGHRQVKDIETRCAHAVAATRVLCPVGDGKQ